MNKLLIIMTLVSLNATLFSQNLYRFDETWWIGFYGTSMPDFTLTFSDDEPIITSKDDPMVNDAFSNASICSGETGRLLFNTNGCWIADSTAQQMVNGDSISPSNFMNLFQYCPDRVPVGKGIIPLEFNDGKSFAILNIVKELKIGNNIVVKYLFLSRIKFSSQFPNGKVVNKCIKLLDSDLCSMGLSACRHANGRDWWIMVQSSDDRTKFTMFLIGPNFVKGPYIQYFNVPEPSECSGTNVFSPDGTKWLHSEWQSGTQIFDFDRETGMLSNFRYLDHPFPQIAGDIIVSPNSRFLYLLDGGAIRQFDITLPDIAAIKASEDTVAVQDIEFLCPFQSNFGGACQGPNGKIYINTTNTTCAWSVINKPNEKGKECKAVPHQLSIPVHNGGLIIPNHPNYRLGPIDGSAADSLGIDNVPVAKFRKDPDSSFVYKVKFTDLSFFNPESWSWDFGDGSFSSDTSPVHVFPGKGKYTVCLTVQNAYGSNTSCREVSVGTVSAGNLIKDYGLSLNPNPCRDYIFLNVKEKFPKALQMKITDAKGIIVQQGPIDLNNGFTTIDVRSLPAGSYFMTLLDAVGGQEVLQFVKL